MATKKTQTKWWYVLVLTDKGPKFVTNVGSDHTAEWDVTKPPYEMNAKWAAEIAKGLTWNGWISYAVCSEFEITHQPYLYSMGHFEWMRENKDGSNEDKRE